MEAKLSDQDDEKYSMMLKYGCLAQKLAAVETRCNDLEIRSQVQDFLLTERIGACESRIKEQQQQLETIASSAESSELERRFQDMSEAVENALAETRRISSDIMGATSRFPQELSFTDACHKQLVIEVESLCSKKFAADIARLERRLEPGKEVAPRVRVPVEVMGTPILESSPLAKTKQDERTNEKEPRKFLLASVDSVAKSGAYLPCLLNRVAPLSHIPSEPVQLAK
jgi:hypothetical protein